MRSFIQILGAIVIVLTRLIASGQDHIFASYEIREFTFQGHEAKIVFPKERHEAGYWIWRARFWAHEPQVDKALLEKGFHIVYVDVANLFGNQKAVRLWNDFYRYCVAEYKLHPKVVLEGMIRGGLIVYNWASENTEKVFTIYADAPVCDIKSWPGGWYNGESNAEAWDACLTAHNLTQESVDSYKGIPLYTCEKVIEAGIPVLHVCGDADEVVPFKENTALVKEKFDQVGVSFELILKKGVGHHPHSLKDPSPIVDFILVHTLSPK